MTAGSWRPVATTPSARLWDVPTGQPHGENPCGTKGPCAEVWPLSPDSKQVLTGSNDKTAPALGRGHREAAGRVPPHRHPVPGVAFRPDGLALATGSEDQTAREYLGRAYRPGGSVRRCFTRTRWPGWRTAPMAGSLFDSSAVETAGPALGGGDGSAGVRAAVAAGGRPDHRHLYSRDGRTIPDRWRRRPHRPALGASRTRCCRRRCPGRRGRSWSPPSVRTARSSWRPAVQAGAAMENRYSVSQSLAHSTIPPRSSPGPSARTAWTVLTGTYDGSAWLWDAASGRRLVGRPLPPPRPGLGRRLSTGRQGLSPRAAAIPSSVTATWSESGDEPRVWDLASGEVIHAGPRYTPATRLRRRLHAGRADTGHGQQGPHRPVLGRRDGPGGLGGAIRHGGWVKRCGVESRRPGCPGQGATTPRAEALVGAGRRRALDHAAARTCGQSRRWPSAPTGGSLLTTSTRTRPPSSGGKPRGWVSQPSEPLRARALPSLRRLSRPPVACS